MNPKQIQEGETHYDTGYRLGRKKYTDAKRQLFDAPSFDAESDILNQWVNEVLDNLDGELTPMEQTEFEAGFYDGIQSAQGLSSNTIIEA